MNGKKVLEIYDKMVSERGGMSDVWSECIRYCYPQEKQSYSAFGGDVQLNGWKRANPVCSYPVTFSQRLGSSIHSNAFPSNDNWFDFSIIGEGSEDEAMREWCRKARDICDRKIRQGTNFYQESHALMIGLAVLGTAGFYTYYKDGGLKFRYIPIHKNFYIASNSDGEIDMVAILHQWTAKEAIEEYGRDKVGENVCRAFDNSAIEGEKFSYIQLIYPKKTFKEKYSLRKGEKPYGDITVEKDSGRVVKESGHSSFPFAVPRFFVYSDDVYGRSPAMNAMADIRAANALRKNMLDASVRAIKPALFVDATLGDVSVNAGALNVVNGMTKDSLWTFPQPQGFDVGEKLAEELKESLRQCFYIDVFQAIEQQKYMTATEINERVSQKVESISPVVTRIQREFSSRVILRCLDLLIENGEIEPLPKLYTGGGVLKVAYISRLDAMIQQGVAAKTMNFMNQLLTLGQTMQAMPDLQALLNTDSIVKALAESNTLPSSYFRKSAQTEEIRKQVVSRTQQVQDAEMNQKNARSLADLSKAAGGNLNRI